MKSLTFLIALAFVAVPARADNSGSDANQIIFNQLAATFAQTPATGVASLPASFDAQHGLCAAMSSAANGAAEYTNLAVAPDDFTFQTVQDAVLGMTYVNVAFLQGMSSYYKLAVLPSGDIGSISPDGTGNVETTLVRYQAAHAVWLVFDELKRDDGEDFQRYCWFSAN